MRCLASPHPYTSLLSPSMFQVPITEINALWATTYDIHGAYPTVCACAR